MTVSPLCYDESYHSSESYKDKNPQLAVFT